MKSVYASILKDKFGPTNRTKSKSDPSKLEIDQKSSRGSRVTTEQIIPSRKGSCSSDQTYVSILNKEVLNEDINIRLLLLPPLSNANAACEKSIMDIHSRSGSVIVEVIRLPGAANHHFRMYVTSCEESVRVVLPPKFRGGIYINDIKSTPNVDYCVGLRRAMDRDEIRVNPMYVGEDEDEVHIESQKRVCVEMVEEGMRCDEAVWVPDGRMSRLWRMLNMP